MVPVAPARVQPPRRAATVRRRVAAPDEQPAGERSAGDPPPCAPCRGTGRVISNLGGSASQVVCPWCEGGGVFIAGHDAQAARRAER